MSDYYAPNQQVVGQSPGVERKVPAPSAPTPYNPADHNSEEVKKYVEEHPEETASVLEAEKSGKNRSTLVAWLSSE